jgi:hypothetical protein
LVEIGVKPGGIPARELGIWTSLRPKRLQNEVCDAHTRKVLDQDDQTRFWQKLRMDRGAYLVVLSACQEHLERGARGLTASGPPGNGGIVLEGRFDIKAHPIDVW